jgi:ergothioneine biosynthesis protein EgtB
MRPNKKKRLSSGLCESNLSLASQLFSPKVFVVPTLPVASNGTATETYQSQPSKGTEDLDAAYCRVRELSENLCQTLQPEDCVVQTVPEVSPTKWHLAHTSWFFETFVVKEALSNHTPLNPQYAYLFNSYYNAAGKMHCRPKRGLISRPTLSETLEYRHQVDGLMESILQDEDLLKKFASTIVLGINHEQQHQELMLTDIKHVFSENPLRPIFRERAETMGSAVSPIKWLPFRAGVYQIGNAGGGFLYDNEEPRHRQFVEDFHLASRLVTNGEYIEFIEDGGYHRPEFWLSLGWYTIGEQRWEAPFYWEGGDGNWSIFTLNGLRELDKNEPVCHVSYFEADAFARWAGARLPTEFEWEVAAADLPYAGNFVDQESFHPRPLANTAGLQAPAQMFGDVWEWTSSSYSPYPGYVTAAGALGEYNGKFMVSQMVLRGSSLATPEGHSRASYRNFFYPAARWQFTGLRLAEFHH